MTKRARMMERGFTLIEAVILMVILGILAFVAYPLFGDVAGIRLETAARRLQSDIRYAQELAMTTNNRTRVTFDTASAAYSIYYYDSVSGWTLATDPYTRGNYTVQLNSGDFTGVLVDSTSFASNQVEFSTNGAPDSGGTVTLSASGSTKNVTVTVNTGRVS